MIEDVKKARVGMKILELRKVLADVDFSLCIDEGKLLVLDESGKGIAEIDDDLNLEWFD